MNRQSLSRTFLILAVGAFVIAAIGGRGFVDVLLGPSVIAGVACLALAASFSRAARGFAFSLWVGAFVAAAMFFPGAFRSWGSFEQKVLIVPLIQIIMFGMGTMLSLADFARVLKMPRAVLIGMALQFCVMPFSGAALAAVFGFEGAVAAGVVLIGSCPGGVASNVMTYISRGNVALSVTMTACSTLVSPLLTPLMMTLLAGQYIEIEFTQMMLTILKIIIAPIAAGLVANRLLRAWKLRGPWLDRTLSFVAMAAICYIIAIITALSRDQLLNVGLALFGAAANAANEAARFQARRDKPMVGSASR